MRKAFITNTFLTALLVASSVFAAPVRWVGNGHLYDVILVPEGITWTNANVAAQARGSGWHLATITSAEENAFVANLASNPVFWICCSSNNAGGPWLGGFKVGPRVGDYAWVTGEPFVYTKWGPLEPFGNGDRLALFGYQAPTGSTWNDVRATTLTHGYIIETEKLTIVTRSLPPVKLGDTDSYQLEAQLGTPPYSWSVSDGTLPPGLNLSADGLLSGTPTESGSFPFTVKVTDDKGDTAEKVFTEDVVLILPPPNVRVHKTGTLAVPGRTLDYFITVENVGQVTATGIYVHELLNSEHFTLLSADPDPVADIPTLAEASVIIWELPPLAPGEVRILTYQVRLNPFVPLGTNIVGPAYPIKDLYKFIKCLAGALLTAGRCTSCGASCGAAVGTCEVSPLTCPALVEQCVICIGTCAGGLLSLNLGKCYDDPSGSGASHEQPARGPIDPNEKLVIAKRFIQPDQLLVYPIHFENIGDVEALDVFVTDVLDPNLDTSTLNILTPAGMSFDVATGTVKWSLLGRNLQPHETDNVLLSIRPKPNLPSGTEIRNKATIKFEIFESLDTNEVVNIIDSTRPTCTVNSLPVKTSTLSFPISWSGTDAVGEIESYSVLASVNGGSFTPFLEKTSDTSAAFTGEGGKTYAFLCIATDTAGNIEVQDAVAETTTTIEDDCPNDPNKTAPGVCGCGVADTDGDSDGTPNCNDQCPNDPNRTTPSVEVCNGLDDNCNGTIDDGFNVEGSCTVGVGTCQRTGAFVCSANGQGTQCNATAGTPSTEVCNGSDDDCDGAVDEGGVCTPVCAANVSAQVSATRGGYRRNSATGRYVQQVTLKNTNTTAIQGPVSLVLDSLSSNAALFSPTGNTSCATPISPYKNVSVGADNILSVGETTTIVLEFTNPTNASITYSARVLGGSAAR